MGTKKPFVLLVVHSFGDTDSCVVLY